MSTFQFEGELKINKEESAYLAGIIDGEGTISIIFHKQKGYPSYGVVLRVYNTNKELLEWIKEKNGYGNIRRQISIKNWTKSSWRQVYSWQIYPKNIRVLLPQILPYLIIKRKQAELTIEFLNLTKFPSSRISKEAQIRRKEICIEMMKLNKRGK